MKKKINTQIAVVLALVFIFTMLSGCGTQETSKISDASSTEKISLKDMADRNVKVPRNVNRVLSVSPATTATIYMLAPEKLIGWNMKLSDDNAKYILDKYTKLPVVGSWSGKNDINYETYISMKPDIVIDNSENSSITNVRQQKLGNIPVVVVHDLNAENFVPYITFMGKLLGAQEKADKLVSFYNNVKKEVSNKVSNIPDNQKVKVYYAESPNGLQTDYDSGPEALKGSYADLKNNQHTQLIYLCGGLNVARGTGINNTSEVSMEKVVQWNPDVIITNNEQFYKNVYSDTTWQNIKAVQKHRIYLTPAKPYSWFDRPPGINTIIGIPWTAKMLYPDKFKDMDLNKLAKEFYSQFYHVNLTDSDLNSLLNNK
ncbi:ABC transporter substrate-binding protein [Clostridium luticellarii]|jgi:iron complex transport system substrate-binding protein|uniref:Corrinoid ABC transporter substrate-binding protein n=1 Tax=Clostridium luticellarii TaxID=1691940 RepID=A0A2T0BMG6_9CLOT|nr:ABC transporter substrate-binding protein [Clostridium luticellarii]MCI1944973.1 ABC transporter substrate-binding protein [Clostridium luticellarii]MCI1967877.1 ABC transporter substrate-binding protein [Clostridium luticellarii]MCI1995754.1 ABC transporter substrate-binding protein [Clostridium luticellarii]MCI2040729.1 ABC transporter substrate-binding protein [Clostridium luticellarii]PRR85067.1 corrinoid ABC transporter substrate-binding protein [Clostridium luticellarii]